MTPAEVDSALGALAVSYVEERRALALRRYQIRDAGAELGELAAAIAAGEGLPDSPGTVPAADLPAILADYRERRRRAEDLYATLLDAGWGNIITDLSDFPTY